MHWADPSFVTGLLEDSDAVEIWKEVFEHFGGDNSQDAEFLHVAGIMAHLFPYALGEEEDREELAAAMLAKSSGLRPEGFGPEFFEGRRDFGQYFAHQARTRSRFTSAS